MTDILIRDVDEDIRRGISEAASRAGRSMQAELIATLHEKYAPQTVPSLLDIFLPISQIEGPELVCDRDYTDREFSFDEESGF